MPAPPNAATSFRLADWHEGFGLKFFAAMRLSRAAWPHLCASSGAIVNIVGIGGRTGSAEFTIGGAVNAALLNLTKALADRGVRDGVRVNAINPGGITTGRLTHASKSSPPSRVFFRPRPRNGWRTRSASPGSESPTRSRAWWRF